MDGHKQNISNVAAMKLCNTCGGCFGICPTQAIRFEETTGGYYLPVVTETACTHCGLCYDVCPGIHFGNTLNSQMPADPFAGTVLNSFVGKATDKKLFDNSQSGGIVSALLAHGLETGRIKGAVTVYMEPGNPPRPMTRIAETASQLYQAQKSKYCPVPLLGFLRELKEKDGPVAVVGLPCHIHGLRNILDKMPELNGKLAFTIGLVCDRVLTYAAMDYLISQSKTDGAPCVLHFRDKSVSGYPGDVHVLSENNKSIVMPASIRMQIKNYFTPARCNICFDKMNIFSDITVGDPHGLNCVDRRVGESMLLVRSENGRDVVQSARNEKAIDIRQIEYELILKGQEIDKKRKQWRGYIDAWKKTGRDLPDYYCLIKSHTSPPVKDNKYMRDLQFSLSLDNFLTRDKLIGYVGNALKKRQLINRLFYPARAAKRVARKLSAFIFGR